MPTNGLSGTQLSTRGLDELCDITERSQKMNGFLQNKKALILGVASQRSIGWGLAKAMRAQGCDIALSYQNDKLKGRVEKLAPECDCEIILPCDVADDTQINELFKRLGEVWDGIDIVVHSLAFAPREALDGDFAENTLRDAFHTAHDISAYSLIAVARAARPLMRERQGAILTVSYLGSERVIPNYNVMGVAKASLEAGVRYLAGSLGADGIRVNAVSPGPIATLAASGIAGFRSMLDYTARNSMLGRNINIEEVGNVGAFLCSDLASGITGEVIYVDGGFHLRSMTA